MDSAPHLLRLRYAAPCDRCGGTIFPGEWAQVVFCEENGTAQFLHKTCPGAHATVESPRPKRPGLLSRALGLHPKRDERACLAGPGFAPCLA